MWRPRLNKGLNRHIEDLKDSGTRILVIGDTHLPFCREGYLEFCKDAYEYYNCNKVIHIGDVVDNHYSSFHDQDPDGDSAGLELERVLETIEPWKKAFPNVTAVTGNHDAIPARKAFKHGLSRKWIKTIDEIYNLEGWNFVPSVEIDNVLYTHGINMQASKRAERNNISVVQGHWHSMSFIKYLADRNGGYKFAMQIGCGVDKNSYAMAYGKDFAPPAYTCGIVLDNGRLPILEFMRD